MSLFSGALDDVKGFFGVDNEFVNSTSAVLHERVSSPFYGYFLVSWVLINWKLLYIAFFLDQGTLFEKTGLLRSEYLGVSIPSGLLAFVYFFLGPIFLSAIFAWVVPYISRVYFRQNIRNQKALRLIELQETQEVTQEQKALVEEQAALLKEETQLARESKRAAEETPELIWEKEFAVFRNSKLYEKFGQIIDSIYSNGSRISFINNYGRQVAIDTDLLVYADSNGIITLDRPSNTISLTDKGKFFLKRYSDEENQLPG